MSVYKCKMCGGDLSVEEGKTVAECEYCGTHQTVSGADDEKRMNLYNNANRLRLNNEFDKAEVIYENIVAEFPEEAEAYWGICLCRYGIEYVDDPTTVKKIPTCHRTSFGSIFDDEDYKHAIENADFYAQLIYRDEATAIDSLQKDILSTVRKEKPYDVFISYKDKEYGQRTVDSVLAQDIYDNLTEKGLRVFFSRISLEDKLGTAYEPYIFAALNSAKVMLVVGTKREHFNAVWVKNEWARYIDFMKTDRNRMIIPCYKDMDANDLPGEFVHLQAQDMGKIGAMQDLVRGVQKIAGSKNASDIGKISAKYGMADNSVLYNTLERKAENAKNLLDLGNFSAAGVVYKEISTNFPESYIGWWGLLLVETKCLNDCFNVDIEKISELYGYVCQTAKGEEFEQIQLSFLEYMHLIATDDMMKIDTTYKEYINTIERLEKEIESSSTQIADNKKRYNEDYKKARNYQLGNIDKYKAKLTKINQTKQNIKCANIIGGISAGIAVLIFVCGVNSHDVDYKVANIIYPIMILAIIVSIIAFVIGDKISVKAKKAPYSDREDVVKNSIIETKNKINELDTDKLKKDKEYENKTVEISAHAQKLRYSKNYLTKAMNNSEKERLACYYRDRILRYTNTLPSVDESVYNAELTARKEVMYIDQIVAKGNWDHSNFK